MKIFIGYDSREPESYHVLSHSILRRASVPVSITPLALSSLRRIYGRTDPKASTEFSLTRFLVPYLSNYEGYSLFMDCDMLCRVDMLDLMAQPLAYPGCDVYVCAHEYTPKSNVKFLGQAQAAYPRKNWSSFMLFDNARCKALTPEYVATATPAALHQLDWARVTHAMPLEWNWLVGEYASNPDAKVLHYTLGGPWFDPGCDEAAEWFAERDALRGR